MEKIRSLAFFMLFLTGLCLTGMAQQVINMSDFGIDDNKDITPVLSKAIKEIKGDAVILFPQGRYNFYPEKAVGRHHSITNHDNGFRYFAFPLMGHKNLTIDGQGSEFIFHGKIIPFLLENAQNITLKNFSIDWDIPFYIQAEVMASDSASSSMTLQFNNSSQIKQEGNGIAIVSNQQYLPFLGEDMYFDPKTKAVAYRAEDYLMAYGADREVIARPVAGQQKQFQVTTRFSRVPPPAGLIGIYKGNFGNNRHSPGIHIIKSKGLKLQDINIYHAGGMGVVAEKSEDIHLNKVNVKLREGSGRWVTTTADATHFCNCRGRVLIENCLFENMLDDASNVHGTYVKVDEIINSNTVLTRLNHMQQTGYEFGAAGDSVQIIDPETLLPKGSLIIENVQYINDRYCYITFKQDIKKVISQGDGLENISWYPELIFRNNVVQNNRARGILVSVPKKVLIENNKFSSMMTAILFEGDMLDWYESGGVKDVTITGNQFLNNGYGGKNYPVIWVNPRKKVFNAATPFEKNIRIENNLFRNFDKLILKAKSVDGLIFRNNILEDSDMYPPINTSAPHIDVQYSKNIIINKNQYKRKGKINIIFDKNLD